MSDTPKSDAWAMNYKRYIGYVSAEGGEVVPISIAREMELEIEKLKEERQNWRISSVCRELDSENKRLRGVMEKIANLSTDQLASPEQCVAVVLAMDALSELPNAC